MPMVTKLARVVKYLEELPPINSHDPSRRWSCEITWQMKYISICRRPMNTKLGKVLTYRKRLSPLKPHDLAITWTMWGHVTIWKIYISTFARLVARGRENVQHLNTKIVPNFLFPFLPNHMANSFVNCHIFRRNLVNLQVLLTLGLFKNKIH